MNVHRTRFFAILIGLALAIPTSLSAATLTGKVTVSGTRDNAGVLVYIAMAPGQFPPGEAVELDQRNIKFEPHVLPIVVGTTVRFLNGDDVQHNVFTPSAAGDFFNLGTWPKGQSKPYTFNKMGKVELLCNVHHEMHGYILVLQNPFFAVTGKAGNFRIDNVPPGNYQLKVWHDHAAGPAKTIRVSDGVLAVNFDLAAR